MNPIGINEYVVDFTLPDVSGHDTKLSSVLEQGPVLLFCFKTDCPATGIAAPFVEGIWAGYREHESAEGNRLAVLGISQDERESTLHYVARHGLSFPILLDSALQVTSDLRLVTTPTLLLLKGRERLRADAARVDAREAFRVVDVVEAWSRAGYELLAEEIATRIGTLPLEIFQSRPDLAEFKPG